MKIEKNLPVRRITPANSHFFFGYYDLQPFNKSGKYHLTHKTDFMDRLQVRGDSAQIGLIDMGNGAFHHLETTYAWNFQQGAMLQWNPVNPENEIIYNDLKDGQHIGVVMEIDTGKKRYLDRPVTNVSPNGKYALSVNMSRLYNFRPGYGYAEPADSFYYKKHSKDDGVFLIDIETGKSKLILSLEQIWEFSGCFFDKDEKIIINHITFNTDGSRFLMLVRNFPPKGMRHDTAVITANTDGSDMYLLSDYGVQSHYFWLNERQLIIYSDGKELPCSRGWGNNYIIEDRTHEGTILAEGYFCFDNHMSVSPDKKLMLTDSYPDEKFRMQPLMLYSFEKNLCVEIGRFYSVPSVCTDVRCDLHPRWNRNGDKITFDSTHEGFRGIYEVDLPDSVKARLFE
ncbi:MAG: hypothetical protein IJF32_13335 [Oscillospiraceae bacterium]|nr:hypothetical protein [Oscillospiraceae bacterium]